jgi:signal transduction histidine kinase
MRFVHWLARTPEELPGAGRVPRSEAAAAGVRTDTVPIEHGLQLRVRPAVLIAGIAFAFVVAFAINLYVLPHNSVVSSLYALPILVAAHTFSPRRIALVGAAGILCYVVNAAVEDRPLVVWPFGILALTVVTYLGALFARQKRETLRRAHEVAEMHRRLQQFMGMIGHDLGAALTGVLGYAELLARNAASPTAAEAQAGQALDATARRVQRLIDDLRAAARIGAEHFFVRMAPMDLAAALRHVVSEQQVTTVHHRIYLDAPPALPGTWDEERLCQLFANLVSNAIAYSPAGSEVRVGVRALPQEVVVSVVDKGDGIPPEYKEALFQPYFRLGHQGNVKGMGLGLYIAKTIADAHGGRIWVESVLGRGSTFHVALPLDTPVPATYPNRPPHDQIK